MAELTPEQSRHIDNLITRLMAKHGINKDEAVDQIHLLVYKGICNWHKNRRVPGTEFDPEEQTMYERMEIGKLMDRLAADHNVTREKLMKWLHVFGCDS